MPRTKSELVYADPPNADTPVDKNLLKSKVKRGKSTFVVVDGEERRICTHESYLKSKKFYFKDFTPVPEEEIDKIETINGELSLKGKKVINFNAYKVMQKRGLVPQKPKKIIPKRTEYVFAEGENKGEVVPKELLNEHNIVSSGSSSYLKCEKKNVKICTYGQYRKLTTMVRYKGDIMSKSTYEGKIQREKPSKNPRKSQGKSSEKLTKKEAKIKRKRLDDHDNSDYESEHYNNSDYESEHHDDSDYEQKSSKQSSNQNYKRKIREFDGNQIRTQPRKKPKPQYIQPQKKPKPQYMESIPDKELVQVIEEPKGGENYNTEIEEIKKGTSRERQTEAHINVASAEDQTPHQNKFTSGSTYEIYEEKESNEFITEDNFIFSLNTEDYLDGLDFYPQLQQESITTTTSSPLSSNQQDPGDENCFNNDFNDDLELFDNSLIFFPNDVDSQNVLDDEENKLNPEEIYFDTLTSSQVIDQHIHQLVPQRINPQDLIQTSQPPPQQRLRYQQNQQQLQQQQLQNSQPYSQTAEEKTQEEEKADWENFDDELIVRSTQSCTIPDSQHISPQQVPAGINPQVSPQQTYTQIQNPLAGPIQFSPQTQHRQRVVYASQQTGLTQPYTPTIQTKSYQQPVNFPYQYPNNFGGMQYLFSQQAQIPPYQPQQHQQFSFPLLQILFSKMPTQINAKHFCVELLSKELDLLKTIMDKMGISSYRKFPNQTKYKVSVDPTKYNEFFKRVLQSQQLLNNQIQQPFSTSTRPLAIQSLMQLQTPPIPSQQRGLLSAQPSLLQQQTQDSSTIQMQPRVPYQPQQGQVPSQVLYQYLPSSKEFPQQPIQDQPPKQQTLQGMNLHPHPLQLSTMQLQNRPVNLQSQPRVIQNPSNFFYNTANRYQSQPQSQQTGVQNIPSHLASQQRVQEDIPNFGYTGQHNNNIKK